jgi:hypothetical protein
MALAHAIAEHLPYLRRYARGAAPADEHVLMDEHHAEVVAIRAAAKNLGRLDLNGYVVNTTHNFPNINHRDWAPYLQERALAESASMPSCR